MFGSWLASASYIGSKTSHLYLSKDFNPPLITAGATSGNAAARRYLTLLNPAAGKYIGQVAYADDGANASYNGMLLSMQHRFGQGYTALFNYTYSHCLGDGDFSGDLRNAIFQNQWDRRSERGDCNFDIRQMLNASIVAMSPIKGHAWAGRLLGNWQIAPPSGYHRRPGSHSKRQGQLADGRRHGPAEPEPGSSGLQLIVGPEPPILEFGRIQPECDRNLWQSRPQRDPISGWPELRRVPHPDFRSPRTPADGGARRGFQQSPITRNFSAYTSYAYGGLVNTLNSGTFGQLTAAGDPRILQFARNFISDPLHLAKGGSRLDPASRVSVSAGCSKVSGCLPGISEGLHRDAGRRSRVGRLVWELVEKARQAKGLPAAGS